MSQEYDAISDKVLEAFNALPAKSKPRTINDKVKEWVPLSGIVVTKNRGESSECVALATGMKCLPAAKVSSSDGNVLHDCHAEVLAIRSFNRFLVQECYDLAVLARPSDYVRWREEAETSQDNYQPFALKDDLDLHIFCSEAPCGDASMELIMKSQDDPTPWPAPSKENLDGNIDGIAMDMPGRAYFSALGIVRRKPARSDAPISLSKSCTDKLALKQATSLLSSLTSLLIHPSNVYLKTLILPASQYSHTACDRAFGPLGRMSSVVGKTWSGGFSFRPFEVKTTSREFAHSRRGMAKVHMLKPSNISVIQTLSFQETLINGIVQGWKLGSPRSASVLSRKGIAKAVGKVLARLEIPRLQKQLQNRTYSQVKASEILSARRAVKSEVISSVLVGWQKNIEDDFEVVDTLQSTS